MGFMGTILDTMSLIGLGNPVSRAVSFGCVGFGLQYFMRPGISYGTVSGRDGKPTTYEKEFYLTSSSKNDAVKTWMPWYMWPVILALIGGLFI